ncbi:hypothetical protein Taro_035470 [Colocasia esculenta]|uniref:Uncharacterized protein n=1 Tax=Colocasia esculenta TaxID=4460 RepID=A0A843VZ22_COLES|nr:hypothetical protein [Colocasia esculenta]
MFLCLFRASESSQQRQGARWAEETGRLAVDVYFCYISCQTRVIALPGPPGPWAATAKIGSSAWAEGRVLGSLQLVSEPGDMAYVAFPSRRPRRRLTDMTGVLCVSTALAVSGERDKMAVAFTFSNSEI